MKKATGNKKPTQPTLTSFFSRKNVPPTKSLSAAATLQDQTNRPFPAPLNEHKKRKRSPSKSPTKSLIRASPRKTPSKKIEEFSTPELVKTRVTKKLSLGNQKQEEPLQVENGTLKSVTPQVETLGAAGVTTGLRRSPRLIAKTNGHHALDCSSVKLTADKVKSRLFSPTKNELKTEEVGIDETLNLDEAFFEDIEAFQNCPSAAVVELLVEKDALEVCLCTVALKTDGDNPREEATKRRWKNLNLTKLGRYQVGKCLQLHNGDLQLVVKSTINATSGSCLIQSPWNSCVVREGDLVSLKGKQIDGEGWVVEWSGIMVTDPDNLISGTSVVGSLFCMRKAVLSELFEEIGEREAKYLVIGSVVHQLLQEVLRKKVRERADMEKICEGIVTDRDFVLNLFLQNVKHSETVETIKSYLPNICNFVESYITGKKVHRLAPKEPENWQGEIVAVRDIEENIWSSGLGIKGKIDATVQVKIHNKLKIMPLELKTGKVSFSMEHRGQVILYCMLLKELGEFVDSGLLLYLKDEGGMKEISAGEREVRDLLLLRNCLSRSLLELSNVPPSEMIQLPDLPPPINRRSCESCGHLVACSAALRHRGLDQLEAGNRLKRLAPQVTSHLTDEHLQFIFHWIGLQSLENGSSKFNLSKLWHEEPRKREEKGSCLTGLIVKSSCVAKGSRFESVFVKSDGSIIDEVFDIGQTVIVSSSTQIAVAFGFIVSFSPTGLMLSVEKYFKTNEGPFVMDCYESQAIKKTTIKNMSLLLEDTERAQVLREAIIDLKRPTFSPKLSSKIRKLGADIFEKLNKEQVRALLQSLSADTYILIQGMPGTGKTTTMRALIELMVRLGKSVLVSSYTHSAIDNILVGLIGKVEMMRIVNPRRAHPKLKNVTEHSLLSNLKNPTHEELEKMYKSKKVVGVSCLGATHAWLERHTFDICLVDEASQVTLPAVLRPLFLAKKFILVGDPKQLPPLVVNQSACDYGLRKSLFHRLDRPAVTTTLTQQYRMNQQITDLANGFSYDNQLKCGSDTVANATLEYSGTISYEEGWMVRALSKRLEDSVVVVDVKNPNSSVTSKDNKAEADTVVKIAQEMISVGVKGSTIGVIATYREQVDLLKNLLNGTEVEISTVDQYQGRDKDVILYTSSKTSLKTDNDILGNTNRLTVAITRAKRKLIIICDTKFVRTYENFAKLFAHIPLENFVSTCSDE